jgi:pimeloyl-ACP methyl ester carboxylesterase
VTMRYLLLAIAAFAASSPAISLPYQVAATTGREEAMIIALPGAGETARMYCDVFSGGRYRRLARQRGYILVCLSDYGISLNTEKDERSLLALRDELVARHPHVKKVFLTGYSVGGRGALLIGLRHPEKFDAVASIVPWLRFSGDRNTVLPEIKRRLRSYPHQVFVTCATLDFFFPISLREQSSLVEAGGGRLRRRRYFTDHWFVVAASANDMFDFFDGVRERDAFSINAAGGS